MKNEMIYTIVEKNEFQKFTNFFIKYLNGSSSSDEAFIRATSTYRKLFKKIPYKSFQNFLNDYSKSEFASMK